MAEQILNYGCLPGAVEAYQLFKDSGRLWGCHEQPDQICGGILRLVIEKGDIVDFSKPIIQQEEY
jgi:hypothetical protein